MGRVAADLLFDMIESGKDRSEVSDVLLPPHLVIRRSTAAPRS
jgi:DNA-binding LacI/PurR family transcriptional regulator